MVNEETTKHHWLRIGAIALITFMAAFLAFYIVMEIMIHRITDPIYQAKRIEKTIQKQDRNIERFIEKDMESPFVPKMRPMMVNLVKEPSEYKVIVDLIPLDGNEKNISINIQGDELTISGNMDKKNTRNRKNNKFYSDIFS